MSRPRAADDFPAIRARLEELRRERGRVSADDARRPNGQRPYVVSARPGPMTKPGSAPPLWRMLLRGRSA